MAERHRLDPFSLLAGLVVLVGSLAFLLPDLGGRHVQALTVIAVVLVGAGVLGLGSAVLGRAQEDDMRA